MAGIGPTPSRSRKTSAPSKTGRAMIAPADAGRTVLGPSFLDISGASDCWPAVAAPAFDLMDSTTKRAATFGKRVWHAKSDLRIRTVAEHA